MKAVVVSAVISVVGATGARAADLRMAAQVPAPATNSWDIGVGGALMSDYNVRGITQSAHKPSFTAYVEPRYNINPDLQLYAGLFGQSIDFPNRSASQIGIYGGFKSAIGKLTVDLGAWYLSFPGGTTFDGLSGASSCTNFDAAHCNTTKGKVDFWEVYARPTYALSSALAAGATVYYSPSVLNAGAPGTYASIITKITIPDAILPSNIGASVFGEFGRYWFGTTDAFYGVPAFPLGIDLPNYKTWNVGLSISDKFFTLDLRYYDTDLSKANCNVLTGDHTATFGGAGAVTPINPSGLTSNWCSAAFIGKLSFDTSLSGLK